MRSGTLFEDGCWGLTFSVGLVLIVSQVLIGCLYLSLHRHRLISFLDFNNGRFDLYRLLDIAAISSVVSCMSTMVASPNLVLLHRWPSHANNHGGCNFWALHTTHVRPIGPSQPSGGRTPLDVSLQGWSVVTVDDTSPVVFAGGSQHPHAIIPVRKHSLLARTKGRQGDLVGGARVLLLGRAVVHWCVWPLNRAGCSRHLRSPGRPEEPFGEVSCWGLGGRGRTRTRWLHREGFEFAVVEVATLLIRIVDDVPLATRGGRSLRKLQVNLPETEVSVWSSWDAGPKSGCRFIITSIIHGLEHGYRPEDPAVGRANQLRFEEWGVVGTHAGGGGSVYGVCLDEAGVAVVLGTVVVRGRAKGELCLGFFWFGSVKVCTCNGSEVRVIVDRRGIELCNHCLNVLLLFVK